jgi:starvation-inducible DNA-binding protein
MAIPPERSNPPFADDSAEAIGRHLQLTVAELIALSLAAKQLQWTVYGPEFLGVHGQLGRLVDEWQKLQDALAGRSAAVGIAFDGTPATVIELADLRPIDPGFTEAASAVERVCADLWEIALRVRRRIERLHVLDPISEHVLADVGRKLEEQLWMLRSQLPE